MNKILRTSKLAVSRETLKALSTAQLERVAGGIDSAPADQCATKIAQGPGQGPTR